MPVMIWPLRARLAQTAFLQQRPRFTGGRKIPERPTSPWEFKKRSLYGKINFGMYDQPPVFRDFGGDKFPLPLVVATSMMRGRNALRLPPLKKPKVVSARPPATRWRFKGFVYDATLVAVAGCEVDLFRADRDVIISFLNSNADGSWEINSNNGGVHYLVAHKSGSPAVTGTTLQTLSAADNHVIYVRDPTVPAPPGMSRSRITNA
jgi:hypothetical protein